MSGEENSDICIIFYMDKDEKMSAIPGDQNGGARPPVLLIQPASDRILKYVALRRDVF